jgi:hypothetical protein
MGGGVMGGGGGGAVGILVGSLATRLPEISKLLVPICMVGRLVTGGAIIGLTLLGNLGMTLGSSPPFTLLGGIIGLTESSHILGTA